LVAATIESLRPAYVLVEGPADMNDRLDELLLGHELPIAVFTYHRDGDQSRASWSPFCEYSPEWVALTEAQRHGAEVRFIDLPAWHPALADLQNRYADAERRYTEVLERLCRMLSLDNVDTLWDHLVEADPDSRLDKRLASYFELVRGNVLAGPADAAREAYMARWVRAAAVRAAGRPVVVVCGGFHAPALARLAVEPDDSPPGWPELPPPPAGATGGSYLVPYSFRRLDAFDGYQSGMPSPEYYQRLWECGPEHAAASLLQAVVARLRRREQPVSTADLVAARAMAGGLSRLRGHRHPIRTDLLDALVSALVGEALEVPLPWTGRGRLPAGTHPVVVEIVAALSGDRTGWLHPDTPLPPLVHDVNAALTRLGLDGSREIRLDLTDPVGLDRSRVLHRLRVLAVPGFARDTGPAIGTDPVLTEIWSAEPDEHRLVALIEAGAYGPTLAGAATARLEERITTAGADPERLVTVLFDAALCGIDELTAGVLPAIARSVGAAGELRPLGRVLAVVLGLWRHDLLLGTAGSSTLGAVITAAVDRVLWLVEGIHGGPGSADPGRLLALVAVRDAIVHAGEPLGIDRDAALPVMHRIAADPSAPPDLRGGAFGFGWSLGTVGDPARAVRGAAAPATLGDWLAGLFALAREEVLAVPEHGEGVLEVLDGLIGGMSEQEFLVPLPALRQAFTFFPPRERATIAGRLLARRNLGGSGRELLRLTIDPYLVAQAHELESHVDDLLAREGL
jgi:hypothetical protein